MRFDAARFLHLVHCANGIRSASSQVELDVKLEEQSSRNVITSYRDLQEICRSFLMPVSVAAIDAILHNLERYEGQVSVVRFETRHLWDAMLVELKAVHFVTVPFDRSGKYEDPIPFGSPVADAFPSAKTDLAEAANCFALRRNTACVFHLMRALEVCLRVLADRFGVASDHTNWRYPPTRITSPG